MAVSPPAPPRTAPPPAPAPVPPPGPRRPPIRRGGGSQRSAARVASALATTPGRMRLGFGAVLAALLLLVVVASGAVQARVRAGNAVRHQGEPLLVGAEAMYTSLADADATATNTFLTPGVEPPDRRQAYLNDLASAAQQLAAVARQAGSSPGTSRALGVITADLPTYSGLVEAARANNRLGMPVGAAYLREGSTLMQTAILPAVGQLYRVEAARLNRAYNSGRSFLDLIGVLLAAAVAVVALAFTQLFVARRTNRILNPGLLAATVLALVVFAWAVVAFWSSGARLKEAQHKGSDPVQLLSSTRILLSRAQVDENLALVARGSGTQYLADFDAVTKALGPADGSSGLLAEASRGASPAAAALTGPTGPYAAYLHDHASVVGAENGGQFANAVATATGDELTAAAQTNAALTDRIQSAQQVFDAKAAAGARDLGWLRVGVIAMVVLAATLAFYGIERRINEYR